MSAQIESYVSPDLSGFDKTIALTKEEMKSKTDLIQTEVNIGGITFKGGKMLAVILALSSTVGVLYGGFEMFKKFQDMSAQIESYVAPDLSGFDKTIALTKEEMKSKTDLIQTEVEMLMSEMEMMMSEIRLVSDAVSYTHLTLPTKRIV